MRGWAILIVFLSLPSAGWPEQPPTLPPPRWLGADAPQAVPAPPTPPEDEGPADGLTLDAALDRLLVGNAALRARSLDVSEAKADELTASLRNSPAIFLSGNAWPYGRYSEQRPGAAEYEIAPAQNVDYSGKRRSHMRQAAAATRQVEALYQNAVREEIDRLHEAFVAVLEAREKVRLAGADLQWLTELEETTRQLVRQGRRTESEAVRISLQRFKAGTDLAEAQGQQLAAKRNLAALLGISPDSCDGLAVRGSLYDRSPPPPHAEDLLRLALESRPDLKAERLGIEYDRATVQAERAETFDDAIVFYSPFEAQNFAPQGKRSVTAWGGGAGTILPILDRNQGEIARARINVRQTEIELWGLERRVANEVLRARTDYEASLQAVRRYEQEGLPAVRRFRDEKLRRFLAVQEQLDALLDAHNDFSETTRQYLEVLARHRLGMLRINTAVGRRILP